MSTKFATNMSGPAAVDALNDLDDRISGVGTVSNGGVSFNSGTNTFTLNMGTNYRMFDLGVLGANSTVTQSGGSSAIDGKTFFIRVKQDGTGGRTLTLDSTFGYGTDLTAISINTSVNKKSYFCFAYDSSTSKCDVFAQTRGY